VKLQKSILNYNQLQMMNDLLMHEDTYNL